jgi:hypothetical protein
MATTFPTRYRVQVHIEATAVDTSVTYECDQDLVENESVERQVANAISYARVVHASRDDIEIGKVWRQAKADGPWEELTTAYRAVVGTKVLVTGMIGGDWSRTYTTPYVYDAWVTVGRWAGMGDGNAILYGTDGMIYGAYPKDKVFATR